ncbi:hypothetical protein ACFW2Y_17600 [Streptomyces sp. NPDC058877]|uniref:hypothetical protein n=1 Tax=unclassified Streptomyces TaxID=2593676 RepID=UPI0036A6F3D4
MVRRRQPDRLAWIGDPLGLPVPEGEDRRRRAAEIRQGDRVLIGRCWRIAAVVTPHQREGRTLVHVEWESPAHARTVYHAAALVHVYAEPVRPTSRETTPASPDCLRTWQS